MNHLTLGLVPTFVRCAPEFLQGSNFRCKQNHGVQHVGKGPCGSSAAAETTTNLDKVAQGSGFLNRYKDVFEDMAKTGCNDPHCDLQHSLKGSLTEQRSKTTM